MANRKTGRERWAVVVWDDPAVREEIERRLRARGTSAASVARDALRAAAGLPPFPAGLPPRPDDAPDTEEGER